MPKGKAIKSEAERRKLHVLAGEGKISKAKVHKMEHETKNKSKLPYHVKKHR